MLTPDRSAAVHKAWLYRILMGIADDPYLMKYLRFKGGTCAAIRGLLDRFSVDLDFDLLEAPQSKSEVSKKLESIFKTLGLTIKDKSSKVPQYFLKYPDSIQGRNTIKVEALFPAPKSNEYEPVYLRDIDRTIICHSIETMFANKLVALMDRYDKHGSVAGRDIYDIHHFFLKGYSYKPEIIVERTKQTVPVFFKKLVDFVSKHVTEKVINQDLNYLLPPENFQRIRKIIKAEVLVMLKDEVERLKELDG